MPELPEVETTIRGLNILIGQRINKVEIHKKKLRYTIPNTILKIQKKSIINSVQRLAKYILIQLSTDHCIIFHLGMSGRLKIVDKNIKKEKHDHFVINLSNSKLVFNDPRRFGFIDFDTTKKIYNKRYLFNLGIDALDKKLNAKYLFKKIYKSEVIIKQILLNQSIVAGIGNIYASEILFDSNISPFTKGKNLKLDQISRIIKSIRHILKKAIRYGGSSIRNYVSSNGTLGNFQSNFFVYDKEGQRISGFVIKKIVQHGRSTYYCPELQIEDIDN